jgi:Mrp family chromosome partitioning ATPase
MNEQLDLAHALQVVRRRGWIVLLGAAVGVAAAWNVTRIMPVRYEATATLFVGGMTPSGDISSDVQYAALAQSLVSSYAQLAETRRVAFAAARASRLPLNEVVGHVTADAQPGVQILHVRGSGTSGAGAARVANAAARALAADVQRLGGRASAPVRLELVDAATAPAAPTSPRSLLNLLLGGLAGTLAGIALGFGRERLDCRIRTESDAERELGLPVLGTIPRIPRRIRRADAFVRHTNPTVAEPFRSLAVALSSLARRSGDRSVLITSARAGEGKSTVAAQLAIASAEDNRRVALVEGDLRRPTLERHFHAPLPRSCRALTEAGAAVAESVAGLLTLLTAGASTGEPGAALRTRETERFMGELSAEHELIIIDAPPMLAVSDAGVLARHADVTLLVVRANVTTPDEARAVVASCRRVGAEVAGVVLVGGRVASRRYYGGRQPVRLQTLQLKPLTADTKGQVAEG